MNTIDDTNHDDESGNVLFYYEQSLQASIKKPAYISSIPYGLLAEKIQKELHCKNYLNGGTIQAFLAFASYQARALHSKVYVVPVIIPTSHIKIIDSIKYNRTENLTIQGLYNSVAAVICIDTPLPDQKKKKKSSRNDPNRFKW